MKCCICKKEIEVKHPPEDLKEERKWTCSKNCLDKAIAEECDDV